MAQLKVGDTMPDLEFKTAFAQGLHTSDIVKGKKTVFWVLRYIGCTTCRFDVSEIHDRYAEFEARNAQVYVVMQSDPAHILKEFNGEHQMPEIICDDTLEIYKTLSIRPAADKEELIGGAAGMAKMAAKSLKIKAKGFSHGDYEGDEMQLPAMFITDENGVLTYAHYAASIGDMPVVDEVLNML